MIISKEHWQKTCSLIKKQDDIIKSQETIINRLKEEVHQSNKLIGLYEACINKGVKIDFPNSAGGGKEDIEDGTDTTFTF